MNIFISFAITISIWLSSIQIDAEIKDKQHEVEILQMQVREAQKIVGLAETPDYIEKIGIIQQLKDEIAELQEEKFCHD